MVTRNRTPYGKMSRHCLQLDQGYAQITGDTNENDVAAKHVFAPCWIAIEKVRVYGIVQAAGSTVIRLYAGSTKAGTLVGTVTLTPTITNALMTLNNPGTKWQPDQEFCLSEEGSAHTLDYLDATMVCRELQA